MRRKTACAVIGLLSVATLFPAAYAQVNTTASTANQPLDLKQVTALAISPGISVQRFSDLLKARTLSFRVTDEILNQLSKRGVSGDKLRVLKEAPQPPPPLQPPPTVGSLEVTCGPAECEIGVNGVPRGTTSSGKKSITGLNPGKLTVDLSKKDPPYISEQAEVTIEAGKTTRLHKDLQPAYETKRQFGSAAFQQFVAALGGMEGVASCQTLNADGELNLYGQGGASTTAEISLRAVLPTMLSISITGSGMARSGLVINQAPGGHGIRTKGHIPQGLEKAGRLLAGLFPASVVSYINAQHMELSAEKRPQTGPGKVQFTATSSVLTFRIELDPNTSLPAVIRGEPQVGAPTEARYSEFVALNKGKVPKHIVMKYGSASGEGAEFLFRSFTPLPNWNPGDFR